MIKLAFIALLFLLICRLALAAAPTTQADLPVSIHIDASQTLGPWKPIWRFFGYDEADFTFMPCGQELLSELSELQPPQVYIRCHHLLTSGDGTPALKWSSTNAYTEDGQGKAVYNWTILDRIFDTYVQRGLKPYAQIGFMPKALSVRPDLYPTTLDPNKPTPVAGGQAYPPKDYNKWRELVYQWVNHCVQRYGKSEVQSWYWEVWNEPNIMYWHGTPEEYFKLYDYAVDGVRRALPEARVGGPEQAGGGGKFLHAFLEHCASGANEATGKSGAPLDFISFHAKGSPRFLDGHVRMGLGNQLNNIESGFATVAAFPQFKDRPIVIGESDPDGCAACTGPQLNYRNSTLYASYTAAAVAHTLMIADKRGINLLGALTWAFEMEGKLYFAGYRVLSTNGIDLPVLNVFRMLAKMEGNWVAVQSSSAQRLSAVEKSGIRGGPDVSSIATVSGNRMAVLTWNYHDDDLPASAANVDMTLSGFPAGAAIAHVTEYRIDPTHSNAYTAWIAMGSPQPPTKEQYSELQKAGRLQTMGEAQALPIDHGQVSLEIHLPRQGVSLLVLTFN